MPILVSYHTWFCNVRLTEIEFKPALILGLVKSASRLKLISYVYTIWYIIHAANLAKFAQDSKLYC